MAHSAHLTAWCACCSELTKQPTAGAHAPAKPSSRMHVTCCGVARCVQPFDYYTPPVISSLFPVRGLHLGGILLTLRGHGFRTVARRNERPRRFGKPTVHAPVPLLCGFGLEGSVLQPPALLTSAASIRGDRTVVCESPRGAEPGNVTVVSLALNGQDFEGGSTRSRYVHIDDTHARTSFPRGGPVVGGPVVRILGTGFVNVSDGSAAETRTADARHAATK